MRSRVLLAAGLALLAAAHLIASRLLLPARADLVPTADVHDALTPGEFAGTLMLGGFRGLAADLLWMRALTAKEAGRYYESLALCEAIARVQPRFEQVWEFMSWDLAYNIAAEVEGEEAKWAWFRAGLGFNIRGCERNPASERLLRHLAWMFFHKGDWFHRRVEATDFAPLVGPLLAGVAERTGAAIEPLPAGPGSTTYQLAERLYRATVALGESTGARIGWVRRFVPLSIERDGNLWRNRGEHRRALARWLDALEAWRAVEAWNATPAADEDGARLRAVSGDSTERNRGRLRRKAMALAARLAEDDGRGARVAAAIDGDDLEAARAELAGPGWRAVANRSGVRWLDEPAAE